MSAPLHCDAVVVTYLSFAPAWCFMITPYECYSKAGCAIADCVAAARFCKTVKRKYMNSDVLFTRLTDNERYHRSTSQKYLVW